MIKKNAINYIEIPSITGGNADSHSSLLSSWQCWTKLLCIHIWSQFGNIPEDNLPTIEKYICIRLFIAALFLLQNVGHKLMPVHLKTDWINFGIFIQ